MESKASRQNTETIILNTENTKDCEDTTKTPLNTHYLHSP